MFIAQRSLTESSRDSSHRLPRRSFHFLRSRILRCVLLSLRSPPDFRSRCYSPGSTNSPLKELCGRKIYSQHIAHKQTQRILVEVAEIVSTTDNCRVACQKTLQVGKPALTWCKAH